MKINKGSSAQEFRTPNAVVTPLATPRLGSEQVSVIRQRMDHGHENPSHSQTTEEVMVVLEGTIKVTVADESSDLTAGDSLVIPAHVQHSIANSSGAPAEWLIVSPAGMQFFGPNAELMSPDWAR